MYYFLPSGHLGVLEAGVQRYPFQTTGMFMAVNFPISTVFEVSPTNFEMFYFCCIQVKMLSDFP